MTPNSCLYIQDTREDCLLPFQVISFQKTMGCSPVKSRASFTSKTTDIIALSFPAWSISRYYKISFLSPSIFSLSICHCYSHSDIQKELAGISCFTIQHFSHYIDNNIMLLIWRKIYFPNHIKLCKYKYIK